MIIHRLRSFDEYAALAQRLEPVYAARRSLEQSLQQPHRSAFDVRGYSYPARQMVDFRVDFPHSHGGVVNWREWLVCNVTLLNNRLRAALHLLDLEIGLLPDDTVYLTEQLSPLYRHLAPRHPRLIGSEFLGEATPRGESTADGIRNEDLTRLSFPDSSLDVVMTFDCLEHLPDVEPCLRELGRVLKPGGRMMWSVPFRRDLERSLIRASLGADGQVVHHEPPEYHGDPLNPAGCLCFRHFGWEMLDQVRAAGFRDAYALTYWSDAFGYLGTEQFMFFAVR
jgi:SAM-dependent methyltransferase